MTNPAFGGTSSDWCLAKAEPIKVSCGDIPPSTWEETDDDELICPECAVARKGALKIAKSQRRSARIAEEEKT